MIIKYNIDIDDSAIENSFKRLINQTYKLLPMREEGTDWTKPLNTLMEELSGMQRLFVGQQPLFFSLLSKLEGLFTLTEKEDFMNYRRTIFECLSLLSSLEESVKNEQS